MLRFQKSNGAFEIPQRILERVSKFGVRSIVRALQNTGPDYDLAVTAIIVVLLENELAQHRDLWVRMVEKAREYIQSQVENGKAVDDLLETAQNMRKALEKDGNSQGKATKDVKAKEAEQATAEVKDESSVLADDAFEFGPFYGTKQQAGNFRIYIVDLEHDLLALKLELANSSRRFGLGGDFMALAAQWRLASPRTVYMVNTYFAVPVDRCQSTLRDRVARHVLRAKVRILFTELEDGKPLGSIYQNASGQYRTPQGLHSSLRLSHAKKAIPSLCLYYTLLEGVLQVIDFVGGDYLRGSLGGGILHPRMWIDNTFITNAFITQPYLYHGVKEVVQNLVAGTHALLDVLATVDESARVLSSSSATEIRLTCTDMESRAQRLLDRLDHNVRVFATIRSSREASRVPVLTLLASIFLPISAATGILSMQTRLTALKGVLYDFAGMLILIGTLTFLAFYSLKVYTYIRNVRVNVKRVGYGPPVYPRLSLLKTAARATLSLFCLVTIASFLVGMIQDIELGWQVLGYGVAAIAGVWVALVIAGVLGGALTVIAALWWVPRWDIDYGFWAAPRD
ncbi:hypothetical protein BJX62DRAFT_242801 [Aspergillus germanicus]